MAIFKACFRDLAPVHLALSPRRLPGQRPLGPMNEHWMRIFSRKENLGDVPPIFSSGLNESFPVVFPLC